MASVASGLLRDFEAVVDDAPGVDRYAVFARLRAELPVFFSERLEAWVVTRHDDVLAVLRDEDGFGVPSEGPGSAVFGRSCR